jgi:deazaflavin-dependent oxidoreductase (nitroreductase family)
MGQERSMQAMRNWTEMNRGVIEEFRANKGVVQGPGPLVLLTIKGAKSGIPRVYPLISVPYQGGYLAVASKGAAPENPLWYHNLLAYPEVTVEVGTETFAANAQLLTGEERARAFAAAVVVWPLYGEYEKMTTREIPVFLISRIG